MKKLCRQCERDVRLADYYRHPRTADGRMAVCKPCHRANMAALAENLRAAGLALPSAAPAYLGALYAGASPAQAFEAARRQALLELPPRAPGDYNREPGRRYLMPLEVEAAIAARDAAIARIRGLANPFSEPATAYLEQAA